MHSNLKEFACCITFFVASVNVWAQTNSTTGDWSLQTTTYERYGLDPASKLVDRIGDTPESVLMIFRDAGMSPMAYALKERDQQQLAEAISILPPLHQKVLRQRLRSISFVENMPNTALTSTVNSTEPFRLFDITIRGAILEQTASEWVAEKEGSCFDLKDSTVTLGVDVGTISAIQYVLLHEATHVVDATEDITPSLRPVPAGVKIPFETPFSAGVWKDHQTPVHPFLDPKLMQIRFRPGGGVLPAEDAKDVYLALGKTPFVSLYGSCARTEDLAEYVTVYHLTQKLQQPFRISIYEGSEKVLVHEPMATEITRRRFDLVQQFYNVEESDQHPTK